ncbi:hypothetical protein AAG570_011616 [Ranatra chinensis]|uniref:Protein kinase domain-containing protein n=1 Tax=Ranatra chinensis TaxID=642074 RepID=A0ABD0YLI3_9HEMI
MGNEKSQPVGLVIEEKAIQADNFWTLHSATFGTGVSRRVTVFLGATDSGNNPSALERFSKNVMIHRHPNILKYVASWKINGQYHLASEEVCPLSQVLTEQTPLQICIGLHSVLKALNFLHDKAASSHNNICQAAIYVTPDGQWKLGGMEYLCRFSDVSAGFLAESRSGRYERGVSPGEENRVPQPPSAIDLYAYGVLVEEVLLPRVSDEVPGMSEFLDLCRRQLQASECSTRPSLSALLGHSFFNHQFIAIHSFLSELPLKTEIEKQQFFRDLSNKLTEYSEEVVASQLGGLLLSRIVLLDPTAQAYLLPQILNPKSEQRPESLFSDKTFRDFIVPKLMSIYCVRDVQVRLTLLTHFKSFCNALTHSQLQSHILPELLVGIKDTNNNLVTATLIALAELVPILGAATVIGGKRAKHFSDGRPKVFILFLIEFDYYSCLFLISYLN